VTYTRPLVPIARAKQDLNQGSTRSFLAMCKRFEIPVIKLNARAFRLRAEDYELLLAKVAGGSNADI